MDIATMQQQLDALKQDMLTELTAQRLMLTQLIVRVDTMQGTPQQVPASPFPFVSALGNPALQQLRQAPNLPGPPPEEVAPGVNLRWKDTKGDGRVQASRAGLPNGDTLVVVWHANGVAPDLSIERQDGTVQRYGKLKVETRE